VRWPHGLSVRSPCRTEFRGRSGCSNPCRGRIGVPAGLTTKPTAAVQGASCFAYAALDATAHPTSTPRDW